MKMTVSFAGMLLSFMSSLLLIVDLRVCTLGILFRKFSPVTISAKLFPNLSSVRFSVLVLMLRSLIHLELSFVQGDVCLCLHSSICRHPV